MARTNDEVAALLAEYADLLAITGGDAYKSRVYEKAARSVAGYSTDLSRLETGELRKIPNVGTSIADKIAEYLATGSIAALEELRARIPAGVRQLTAIPALGPKRALLLHQKLGIASAAELTAAIKAGQLRDLPGFGRKTEENILRGIEVAGRAGRIQLDVALQSAEEVVSALSAVTGCARCCYAGSLRRMRETIGDVDILTAYPDPRPEGSAGAASPRRGELMEVFASLPQVSEVIARGEAKTSVRTSQGLQMDMRVVPLGSWGAALQYFTGSKAHNIRTRELAVRAKLKLSEYGLFDAESGEPVVSETEEEVYQRLGMPWIHPALREDTGEIEAALAGSLPALVELNDIRGDLHTHTNLTDGVAPLEDMISAAARRGYEYYAVTDHAPNLFMQRMTDEKMLGQRRELHALGSAGEPGEAGEAAGPGRWRCCTARSSTSTPMARWTGRLSSSSRSTCAWPRCIRTSGSPGAR